MTVLSSRQDPRSLQDEVQFLKGVGPHGAQILAKMGIFTIADLLHHIPHRYEDRTHFCEIHALRPGEPAVIKGRVITAENLPTRKPGLTLTKVLVNDLSGVAQMVFFQQPYLLRLFEQLKQNQRNIIIYGSPKYNSYGPMEMERVEWEEVSEESDPLSTNRIVPVYPATEGIGQQRLRKILDNALSAYLPAVPDILPPEIAKAHNLMGTAMALRNIHYPESFDMRDKAHRRLVFEEFFLLQVGLARKRLVHSGEHTGIRYTIDAPRLHEDMRGILPFELTGAQKRAIDEIALDMSSGRAMNRLLQGDVGSGKTVVAMAALLMTVENNFQAALMAPTEILAVQHAIVLRRLLEPEGINVELSIGSQRSKLKEEVRARIASGESKIIVGTHALIQDGVEYKRLGLVIIDEQHRFGVLQRQALQRKGNTPHVLVMTATPIPRTLTMTIYGDLDTSIINELPPGRKPIKTHWKRKNEAPQVYSGAARLIRDGRQVYVVCPLVEESEKKQAVAATQLAERITRNIYPEFRVGLLHGQMKSDEKDETMRRFKAHELDVLVATTVIEVGIDVPNATVMIVEDADQFGLAQLHQLRGRVGRGDQASFCILLADPRTDDGMARLTIMSETTDGFRIAEEDLRLRGPGEFFSTKQSGIPSFYIGDIITDISIMDETREAAFKLILLDPNLAAPEHRPLLSEVKKSSLGFELAGIS